MTLLDVINLDKMWTANSMREKKLFVPRAKVGAALVWNLRENQNK